MARVAPEDKYAGLADAALLAHEFPDLDLLDPDLPSVGDAGSSARATPSRPALRVKGVSKSGGASASAGIGGMVLVTSHGFHGAYLGSRHSLSMTAIAGEGTGMERDYDFSSALHAADLEAPEKIGRTAGERAVERLNPRKVTTRKVPVVFDPRVAGSLVGASGQRDQRRGDRAQDELPQGQAGRAAVRRRHPHRRRSAAQARPALAAVRRRRRRRRKRMALIEDGVLQTWLLDSATARELGLATTGHAQRGVSSTPSPGATNLHLEAGKHDARRTDRRHRGRLLRHRPDRLRRQRRHRRLQPRRLGLLDRERQAHLSGERGDDRRPNLLDMFRTLTPANDLEFRYGTNAPTVRVEGLTVAGH